MTDEQLESMTRADANASLSLSDMHRWVQTIKRKLQARQFK